jgi:opacity protein-like surface antigen
MRVAALAVMALTSAFFPLSAMAANFEITPFAGYTWGGEFTDAVTGTKLKIDETANYGMMVDINLDKQSQIELYFSRQATQMKADTGTFTGNPVFDLDIDYYHIGGTYIIDPGKVVRPFVVGTLGATHMNPKESGLDSVTKFSFSLGGGVKLFVTEHVGLRLEGRWLGTLFNDSGAVFCSSGRCAVNVQGDLFSQFVANAGLIIAF